MKKYELTKDTLNYNGKILHRIKALRDVSDTVHKGDVGGFVEREANLSQDGEAWIYGDAIVLGNAVVKDDAIVTLQAVVCDDAVVYGKAAVGGNAIISCFANIGDYANVYERARITEFARVIGHATVKCGAIVCGSSIIQDFAEVCGDSNISGSSVIGCAVRLSGLLYIRDAFVYHEYDYLVFKNWWSSGRYFTWTRSNDMWNVGCFHGTAKQLLKKAYGDSRKKGREYRRIVRYVNKIKKNMPKAESRYVRF